MKRLLVPLDCATAPAERLQAAARLARALHAELDLLLVLDPKQQCARGAGGIAVPYYVDQPQHEWPAWSQNFIERYCRGPAGGPPEVPVTVTLQVGDLAAEVDRYVRERKPDAMALIQPPGKREAWPRAFRALIRRPPCPIVLLSASPPPARLARHLSRAGRPAA